MKKFSSSLLFLILLLPSLAKAISYTSNFTNNTLTGMPTEFRLKWTSDIGLSGYIFSFDNGTGNFVNDSSFKEFTFFVSNEEGWKYRRNITINNSANSNTLTDYQIAINLTYDSNMKSDFSDLRFTWYNSSSNSEIEIPYWIESYTPSSYAEVWVKVPYIKANGYETVYVYYGNPSANSKSNGLSLIHI